MYRTSLGLIVVALASIACTPDSEGGRNVAAALAARVDAADREQATRRVWARAGDYSTPSPDGRHIAFVDWSTGDVAMHNLETGEDARLTDKGGWIENGSWAEEPLFSPDGTSVAYAYGNVLYAGKGGGWRYELQFVELGDTQQHLLYAMAPEEWVMPMDWSETRGIAVRIDRVDRTRQIALIDPETKALEVLETFPAGEQPPAEGFFSPNNRYLALRRGDRIYLRDLEGGGNAELGQRVNSLLGWTPDGAALLIHTAHNASIGIWALPLEGRTESGELVPLEPGLPGVFPGGRVGNQYFYIQVAEAPKLYRAAIDAAEGRMLAEPAALTSVIDGRAGQQAWSPDGTSLAYTLTSPSEPGARVMVMATDGDPVRVIARIDTEQDAIRDFRWTADGKRLAFITAVDGNGEALFHIDIGSGSVTQVGDTVSLGHDIALLDDGERVVYVRRPSSGDHDPQALVERSMITGEGRLIADLPPGRSYGDPFISPDGSHAAVGYREHVTSKATGVELVTLASGHMRTLYEIMPPMHVETNGRLAWTPDGKHLVMMQGEWESPESHELISLSVDDGDVRTLLKPFEQARNFGVHPDGRRFSFVGGESRQELWVLDDIRGAVERARGAAGD